MTHIVEAKIETDGPAFLVGGGRLGAMLRGSDWSVSPLGHPETWPPSLRCVVGLMLGSKFPMLVGWGAELRLLYNDAFIDILGEKHPKAFGARLQDVWAEIWPDIGPLIDAALAGEAIYRENLPLVVNRKGYNERTWFTFSYSPMRDESGHVAGMFCTCTETTELALSGKRRDALLELDERLRDIADTADLSFAASEVLGEVLGAARVGYGAVDPEAGTIVVERNWYAPGFDDLAGVHRFADYGSYINDLRQGDAVANADVETDPRTAANAGAFSALGIRAHLDVPVAESGRVVGQVFVHSARPRVWTDEEVAFVREIAERTRAAIARRVAEQELRGSEARLTARVKADKSFTRLFQASPAPFLVVKPDAPRFTIAEVNDAYLAATMRTREELVGRGIFEAFPDNPDDAAIAGVSTLRTSLERALATRRPDALPSFEYDIARPDGTFEERWWSPINSPVLDDDGEVEAIIHNANDITDSKRAEERLRELNETLERRVTETAADLDRMWRNAGDIFVVVDGEGAFRRVNPAATAILGWSEAEMLGRTVFDFVPPDDVAPTLGALEYVRGGAMPTFENRYRTKDGRLRTISWLAAPEGTLIYAYGRDVTAEKEREVELAAAQEALRQAQKMEAMGQLTGGVAHDFNNLLTPIIGSLDMLQRKGLGGEREQRLIAGAAQSAERAKTLVQRLLAFARRQPLQAVPVDIAKLVTGMGELVASTTGPQIKVVVEAAEDLPAAKADPNQLEMALLNLSVNARDAMPDGGTLRISASSDRVGSGHRSGLRPDTYIRLSVADTGSGMDEATLARAVEPFFSTKGVGKGTGLGLSMVHGLASQLGGALTIQSRPGLGTNIELWLPQSAAAPEISNSVPGGPSVIASCGRALLVDDEELVRMSTADMLVDLGYVVVEAASGEEAMRLIDKGERFDLLVTDHLMSGMTGTDLARAVRSVRAKLPVLLVSGYAENEGIAPDLPRLTKPFRKDELASSISQISTAS